MTARPARGLVVALVLSLLPAAVPALAQGGEVVVLALSQRADLVSGGQVLAEVVVPPGADQAAVRVDVDGRDVTSAFAVRADGRFLGLVDGLAVGVNRLTARLPDGSGAYLDLTNHALNGPVISGPQVEPWLCANEALGLGPAQDEDCTTEPVVRFSYKSSLTGQFAAYDPDNPAARRRDHDHRPGRDRPVHRRRGARRDGPRCLRHRRAARPGAAVGAVGAAGGLEPQAAHLLRRQLQALAPDGRRRRVGDGRLRALARLHGHHQPDDHVRPELQRRHLVRGAAAVQGAHHRALRGDPLHVHARVLGRVDAAALDRRELPRAASTGSSRRAASPTSGRRCRRPRTATCSTTSSTR